VAAPVEDHWEVAVGQRRLAKLDRGGTERSPEGTLDRWYL
jgi:hypothetical protein